MELWTQSYWPTAYDYHRYDIYDKMHHYNQAAYQQYPMYRVPPVFHAAVPLEQYSAERSPPSPPHGAGLPQLDGSFGRGRCRVSLGVSDPVGRGESTGERCRSSPDDRRKEDGVSRRESTPDSTASDPADSRSFCRVLTFQDQNGQPREMVFPKALDLDRPKRARTSFTSYQLERLEQEFRCNQFMVGRDRARLATNLDLTETQVKVWFQNRRTKYKREQCRAAEFQEKNAESIAACNILKLLQGKQGETARAPPVGSISPIQNPRMTSW